MLNEGTTRPTEPHEPKIDQSIVEDSLRFDGGESEWQTADTAAFLERYARNHAQILDRTDKSIQKKFVIMDEMMGGLGNRLGSIVSGALLAFMSDRALIVASDLPRYFLQGDPTKLDMAHVLQG